MGAVREAGGAPDQPIHTRLLVPSPARTSAAAASLGQAGAVSSSIVGPVLRRARRRCDLSQRQLAARAGVSQSLVGAAESGARDVGVAVFVQLLAACGWTLVVTDCDGRRVSTRDDRDTPRDQAGRRYPAHLDLRVTGPRGDWWGDKWPGVWGVPPRPRWTYDLDRYTRDWKRSGRQDG